MQVEACTHLNRSIQLIKNVGAKPGVVLNPSTPLTAIEWVLDCVDYVLIMSVNPGFGGQKFIPNSIQKITKLRQIILERKETVLIEVDGGVNLKTIHEISEAGADVFVAGSAIFNSDDYQKVIRQFRRVIIKDLAQ